MWTSRNRARYDRSKLRYPSDVTDEEWELIVRLIPPGKSGGGKRTVIMREVVNGLMYVLSTGCQWRAIPKDLPPKSTVYDYFDLWTYDGTLQRIHPGGEVGEIAVGDITPDQQASCPKDLAVMVRLLAFEIGQFEVAPVVQSWSFGSGTGRQTPPVRSSLCLC